MSKQHHDDILDNDDKGARQARGILTLFWRRLLQIRKINGSKWDYLMRRFLSDPRNGVPDNPRDRSSTRGNVNRELRRDNMTWKVFMKAMSFIGAKEVTITLSVTFDDNKTYHLTGKVLDPRTTLNVIEDESDADDTLPDIPEIDEVGPNTIIESRYQRPRLGKNPGPSTAEEPMADPYHRQRTLLRKVVNSIPGINPFQRNE